MPQAQVLAPASRRPGDYDNALFAKYVKRKAHAINMTQSTGLKLLESNERLQFQQPQATFQTPVKTSTMPHASMGGPRSHGKMSGQSASKVGTLGERWRHH